MSGISAEDFDKGIITKDYDNDFDIEKFFEYFYNLLQKDSRLKIVKKQFKVGFPLLGIGIAHCCNLLILLLNYKTLSMSAMLVFYLKDLLNLNANKVDANGMLYNIPIMGQDKNLFGKMSNGFLYKKSVAKLSLSTFSS